VKLSLFLLLISFNLNAAMKVALTVDDLPASGKDVKGYDRLKIVDDFTSALKKNKVKGVYGFLNGVQAVHQEKRLKVLKHWKKSGHYIGNHTFSHKGLTKSTIEEYKQEIERNESLLIDYADSIKELKVFRYTYLEEGETSEKRYGIRSYLSRRNYRIAQVSLDSSDWYWLESFSKCASKNDIEGMEKLKKSFLDYSKLNIKYSDDLAKLIWGKSIPHILLMHINAFTTYVLNDYLALLKKEGVSFVDSKKHIFDKFYDEDTTFIHEHGKTYVQQALETRKLVFKNLKQPQLPKQLDSICN
jgi:peptidoglycan-N-acetylglucosamine deacetylase